jgi:hypothetical protein
MSELTENDFKKHLREQIDFLLRSANSYDEGFKSEAKRMAVILRVLFHDHGKNSVSLLTHLNKKDMFFYDSAHERRPNILEPTLTHLRISNEGASYVPNFDDTPISVTNIKVNFDKWWNNKVIKDQKGNTFTRNELVTKVCNQDGGAHIDAKLDKKYADLTRNNSIGWIFVSQNGREPVQNIELASIRQITFEVLKSLKDEFPEYFD